MKSISVQELQAALASSTPPHLLDVRRKPTFQASADLIAGAEWRDPEQVDAWVAGMDTERPVVVYCVHGHEVSQGCAGRLAERGLVAAFLEGGIESWRTAGGAMTRISDVSCGKKAAR
jgi:rhodanese-related sulfurtransferase